MPHYHPQRVPGDESLANLRLGFEQVVVGNLDEGEVGHGFKHEGHEGAQRVKNLVSVVPFPGTARQGRCVFNYDTSDNTPITDISVE